MFTSEWKLGCMLSWGRDFAYVFTVEDTIQVDILRLIKVKFEQDGSAK